MRRGLVGAFAVAMLLPPTSLVRGQDAPSPRHVEVRAVFAGGGRALDAVREPAARAAAALARCDQAAAALVGEPQLTVRLEVAPRGAVTSAHLVSSPPHGSGRWVRCVTASLAQLRFARGAEGVVDVVVAWRFDEPADSPGVIVEPAPLLAGSPHDTGWGRAFRSVPREELPPLERETIRRIVLESLAPVRRCYEREVAVRPDAEGRLRVRFAIDPDGSVSSAEAMEDELGSATLTTCVRYEVRRWRFPRHVGVFIVEYPFVFRRAPLP